MKKIILGSLAAAVLAFGADNELIMATTTSTDNTGLLDAIYPAYKAKTGVDIKWTAVGTGAALKLGEDCNADILFVHSPKVEKEFVEKGFGLKRNAVLSLSKKMVSNSSHVAINQAQTIKKKASGKRSLVKSLKKIAGICKQVKAC